MQSAAASEQIVWTGTPSHWGNAFTYTIGILFCWLIVPALIALYVCIRTAHTNYTLTNERFRIEWGLLTRRLHELELYRVKDTALRMSFVERMLGIGSITIVSSDRSTPRIILKGIRDPRAFREAIRYHSELLRQIRGVREFDMAG